MRHLDQEIVCAIIIRARGFDAKVDVVEPDPGSNPTDDQDRGVLEDYADDATQAELKRLIDELNVDEAAELVALFWIGRGDYAKDQLDDAMREARRADAATTSTYLMGDPQLADFLEEGLAAFGLDCEELDAKHL